MDGTGTVLFFAGLGMLPGFILGLIGKPWLLWASILAGLALVVWQIGQAKQDADWYAVGHVIIIAATIWAVFVMSVTYIIVTRIRRSESTE